MQQFDTIIIGSGLGGLTTALALAKAGQKVVVLEQHVIAGGYATNFQRRTTLGTRVTFDASLHGIGGLLPGGNTEQIIADVGLTDQVTFIRKAETATLMMPDGNHYDIPDDFMAYQAFLIAHFPQEQAGIERLFHFIADFATDMEAVYAQQKAPAYFQQLQNSSLHDFLSEYTTNSKLIEMFSFLWLYYGLPSTELSALYYLLAWISYHLKGTFYVQGGAQALSDAYVCAIREHGGEVILREMVVSCAWEDEQWLVTTKKQHTYRANQLVFNGAPQPLLETIVAPTPEVQAYQAQLASLEVGISLTQMYLALDCLPQHVGLTKADYFTHQFDSATNYEMVKQANYAQMDLGIVNYNLLDPDLNPEQGVICLTIGDVLTNWPVDRKSEAYKAQKAVVTEQLLQRLYELFPEVEGHIIARELGTPVTMARYTHNPGGAVYGFAQSLTQAGFLRPYVKTPINKLYLASSWANPGGGYEGAMMSGLACARQILKDVTPKATHSQQQLMPLEQFMQGMAAQVQPQPPFTATYQFCFKDEPTYGLYVSGTHAHVKPGSVTTADVTITVSYPDWVALSNKTLSGDEALQSGRLVIEGELTTFFALTAALNPEATAADETTPVKLVKGSAFIPLALIPWIGFWLTNGELTPVVYLAFTLIWSSLFFGFVKPKVMRMPSTLELGTLLCFGVLPLLPAAHRLLLMNVFLIGIWGVTVVVGMPLTAQYARYEYPLVMQKSELFQAINRQLTLVWTLVFTLQALGVWLLPSPWHFCSYSLIAIGVLASILYPKYRLGQLKFMK